ncbi:DUF4158 domain-containing protein [Asticcacaulis sp. W401b]|uniref:DUF4158 domain-containing protein n=1 Tax=Asticcacaulis sp. W401b TaxID=3388666 RepID=UPI003970A98B
MSSAWNLSLEELELVRAKPAVQRLGFAIQLRMYRQHGRFFETAREDPVETIEILAAVLGRPITDVLGYDWEGRSGRRHRDEILKLADTPRLSPEAREAFPAAVVPTGRGLQGYARYPDAHTDPRDRLGPDPPAV